MKLTDLNFGDCVKVECTATGRYLGNGKALYVSAMSNDLFEDKVKKPIVLGNPYNLPMPSDKSLEEHINKSGKCKHCGK